MNRPTRRPALFAAAVCLLPVGGAGAFGQATRPVQMPPPSPATRPVDVRATTRPAGEQRLSFQTFDPYSPRTNLNADVAMVYGIDPTLPARIKTWRDAGYTTQVMTGVAWGEYQDYYFGRWDGKHREDEAQTMQNGEVIGHGGDVYYIAPGEDYGRYLTEGVQRAIDAGATAIYLEEPEFWVRAGWSGSFKRQWQNYYNEPWQSPVSSPEAQYRASKLKYYLYKRALSDVFAFVKDYGKKNGRDIPCYVPTHSLINYASWGIVSPESSLLDVGCDGYIAQVWTGTARTPNFYEGVEKERTFETAFLEYGSMQNLVRASGRRVWYLNDPIEDNPRHSWFDYRTNWESTLVASLLQPEVYHYEIMPWPKRIYERDLPATQPARGEAGRDVKKVPIPPVYETELAQVITAMGDLKQPPASIQWERAGSLGAGVLVSDTMMFQRFGPDASDPQLGSFYGLALPLLMRGLPVDPVQIETADLSPYKVLLLTYEGQKPPTEAFHVKLAAWVRAGGGLVVVDNDRDPFNKVREWWNMGEKHYATPREDLFEKLGLKADQAGTFKVGKGTVAFVKKSPAAWSRQKQGADQVRALVRPTAEAVGVAWKESAALVLRRGPYLVAAGLDDPAGNPPPTLTGRFLPLFDPTQTVVSKYKVYPGRRGFLIDLDALPSDRIGVIAAACRAREEVVTDDSITFRADGVEDSPAVVTLMLPAAPKSVSVDGKELPADAHDFAGGLLRVRFTNRAKGVAVEVRR